MQRTTGSERGVALAMALGAIVIIGVIVAGAVFVATQDYRMAANTVRETRALALADLGLNRVVNDWQTSYNTSLQTGDTLTRTYNVRGGTVTVLLTRLPGAFFWAVSEGTAGGLGSQASARRRYGTLFRLNTPQVNVLGAITTQGQITVSGNVTVNGNDVTPTGWPSCTTQNVAGAAISPTTTYTSNGGAVNIQGNPSVLTTSAAGDTNTYFSYGGSNYQSLASAANLTYPTGLVLTGIQPIAVGAVCQVSSIPANWGDPNRASPAGACEKYFPIIHVLGDMKVTTGRGQGVLLVDGDFTAAGNFVFTGLVITRGSFKTSGTGNKFTGAVLAANVSVDDDATLTGNTTIQYSSCALGTVLSSSATFPKQAKERGWVDAY